MTLIDLLVAATPTPAPLDEDTVTPGWIGFVVIFALALVTVFLIIDMTRRVRRVRYREEIREKLANEEPTAEG
jgi:predicted membrane channel-forming protein YqfA (hemolysin III family)